MRSENDDGNTGQRNETEREPGTKARPFTTGIDDADVAPGLGAEAAQKGPDAEQRERQQGAIDETVEGTVGEAGIGSDGLDQKIKPGGEQRAAKKYHDQENQQGTDGAHSCGWSRVGLCCQAGRI
jgi:hypothetical protein